MIDWSALVIQPLIGIFGEPVTYAPDSGASSFVVNGVFDEAYRELEPAGGFAVTTEMPVLGVRQEDFIALGQPLPRQDDEITIQRTGEVFVVKEVQPDGHGHLLLKLNFVGVGA